MMCSSLLLIDFENVQQIDLSQVPESFDVLVFVGSQQKNLPFELVQSAQQLGQRLQWLRVYAVGHNALDFLIACQLGRILETQPDKACIVLSKDKGFDPLLRYLNQQGLKCRRIERLFELDSKFSQGLQDDLLPRITAHLKKMTNNRPASRMTLANSLGSAFRKDLNAEQVDYLIAQLLQQKLISEKGNKLIYHLS